ncbi:GNAT family N-acetyltransferase [Actinophytocola algeriensis]|uniref:GNAT superfamily N-acetyltransferase n=1 Tax=Actinophytocola algeriensis TaxID=1768010 RepID=A0A7W7Q3N9_9PSEU|nr:GNAT family N-acetyltransferase [Actinophytocola algeriensis]MBB4906354.1 GNAT superfamily N-acetyltransferase [Actinophytocola algeriensis]MBE1477835.1 GNAT superfamily N-acetyltransferase [Actinophytocola algeriensis]
MSTVTVRRATAASADVVADMWVRAAAALARAGLDQWQYPVKLHNIHAAIAAGTCWLASDSFGAIVGTITLDQDADPEMWPPEDRPADAFYLHRMITEPAAKGVELGSALIDWSARRAVEAGRKWIRLDAWRSNPGLWKYYADRGFELVRVVPHPSGSGACFQRDATIQLGHGPTVRTAA